MKLAGAVAVFALPVAAAAGAEDRCQVNAVVGGKSVVMTHCVAAVYDDKGLTLFFSENPIGAEEKATFEMNSYPQDTDPEGRPRSMMHLAFCPGGGSSQADPGAVRSVEMSLAHASSPMLQRQWVFELPKDKELRVEKLAGTVQAGGRITGRVTGEKASDGLEYSWQAEFDLALPATAAVAGPGCGD